MSNVTISLTSIIESAVAGDTGPYAAADVKIKNAVRAEIMDRLMAAVDADDFATVKVMKAVKEALVGAKVATKVDIDVTAILANKIATLRMAADTLASGEAKIDGVDYTRLATLVGDVDLMMVDKIDAGLKIGNVTATGQVDGRAAGVRAAGIDLQAHLDHFLAQAQADTFYSVRQICKHSSDVAPDGLPSDGAVATRLFREGGTTFAGDFAVIERTQNNPRGIRTAA